MTVQSNTPMELNVTGRRSDVRSPWSSTIRLRPGVYRPIGNRPGPVADNATFTPKFSRRTGRRTQLSAESREAQVGQVHQEPEIIQEIT
jgi:hypothetical protein